MTITLDKNDYLTELEKALENIDKIEYKSIFEITNVAILLRIKESINMRGDLYDD